MRDRARAEGDAGFSEAWPARSMYWRAASRAEHLGRLRGLGGRVGTRPAASPHSVWHGAQRHAAVGAETRRDDVHMTVGAHRLREPHVRGLFEQRVMQEVADVDQQ